MNVSSTQTNPVGSIVLPAANVNSGKQVLGQSDFMKLLAAQLSAQDPMNPMKDTEFIAQMANFSALDSMRSLSTSFTEFASEQRAAALPQYLGKEVTVFDSTQGEVSGVVTDVKITEGGAGIVINGVTYDPNMIISVRVPASSAAATQSPTQ